MQPARKVTTIVDIMLLNAANMVVKCTIIVVSPVVFRFCKAIVYTPHENGTEKCNGYRYSFWVILNVRPPQYYIIVLLFGGNINLRQWITFVRCKVKRKATEWHFRRKKNEALSVANYNTHTQHVQLPVHHIQYNVQYFLVCFVLFRSDFNRDPFLWHFFPVSFPTFFFGVILKWNWVNLHRSTQILRIKFFRTFFLMQFLFTWRWSQVHRKHIEDMFILCISWLIQLIIFPTLFSDMFFFAFPFHYPFWLISMSSFFLVLFLQNRTTTKPHTKQEQFIQSSNHFNGHSNCNKPCVDFLTTNRPTIQIHQQHHRHHPLPMTRANWIRVRLNAQATRCVQRCWQYYYYAPVFNCSRFDAFSVISVIYVNIRFLFIFSFSLMFEHALNGRRFRRHQRIVACLVVRIVCGSNMPTLYRRSYGMDRIWLDRLLWKKSKTPICDRSLKWSYEWLPCETKSHKI